MASSSKTFAKACSLKCHVQQVEIDEVYDIDQRRFVSADEKRYILDEKLLKDYISRVPQRKIYVCYTCLQQVKIKILNPAKKIKQDLQENETVPDIVIDTESAVVSDEAVSSTLLALENGKLSNDQVNRIISAIGCRIRKSFTGNSKTEVSARITHMKSRSYTSLWQLEENVEWKLLMRNICELGDTLAETSARRLTKSTDLVRAEVDNRYISDVALSEALLLLKFSHSKYAVDVFCRTNVAGSFSTVRRTMALLGSSTPFRLPSNDVIIVFDNNQVIQRTWMFKHHGKQVVSTVTTMTCYQDIENKSNHQLTSSIPTALFITDSNSPLLLTRYKDFTQNSGTVNRIYRKSFIESRLAKIIAECKLVNGDIQDVVSENKTTEHVQDSVFDYTRVENIKRRCRVKDIECLPENPNSYKAVANVLDKVLQFFQEDPSERKFIPVYMDGSPYSICMKLVRDKYVCESCKTEISATEKITHVATHHKNDREPKWTRKYKPIAIRPGSGHIEMTAVRSIMSTFWVPFIKPIAAILGYNSESQLEYCKKAFDHHKSYNLLMVVFAALADELMYPFVRHSLLHNTNATYEEYCTWAAAHEKKNLLYKLASIFCFTTLHSLHLFRCGIRNCNDEVSLFARHKLTSLLYGCHNIKYHEILCYDTLYLFSVNPELRHVILNESSRRENGDVGEGYDFLLENRNKLYKSLLPSDSAPTFEQWLQVTKTASDLEEIQDIACERLELNIRPSAQRPKHFNDEIIAARTLIRQAGLLLRESHTLTPINDDNARLDPSFLNYQHLCEKNRDDYYNAYLRNEKIHLPLINTGVEVEPVHSKDEDLKDAVVRKLNMLREPFYSFYKKAYKKNLSKPDLLGLHNAVDAQLQNQDFADYESLLSDAFHDYIDLKT